MNLIADFTVIKQGAEGKLYTGLYLGRKAIAKERFRKLYRHSDLDENLTKERMKAEAKAIVKSKSAGVRTPAIFLVDFESRLIIMEEIENSLTVKDHINHTMNSDEPDSAKKDKLEKVSQEIGASIAKLHKNGIVHGDLTSSNLMVKVDSDGTASQLYVIDFGLSQLNPTSEDKGVDLYVLERALLSTHKDSEQIFTLILESYKKAYKKGCDEVFNKLEEIRARGRKRTMVG